MKIPFNIPYISGNESIYVKHAISNLDTTTSENYVNRCRTLIKKRWNFKEVFLTNSCTSAIEVCALLLDLKPGDEVIVPSYTFPSTANAFLRQGATVVFADSKSDQPGIDEKILESLITERTKAIVPVHYAGIACDMDRIIDIADNHGIYVIEDAAPAFDGYYKSNPLGGIGHLGCLSFHQTKNLQCFEGGAIVINDSSFLKRALNILEKGTNRSEFISGYVGRYEWVDIGSSFLMSELHAAYLYAQIEQAEWIKKKRLSLWNLYNKSLKILQEKELLSLPLVPKYAEHNAHTYYIVLRSNNILTDLKSFLEEKDIQTAVHYTSLDQSIFWKKDHSSSSRNTESLRYNDCLLRLPLFNSMTFDEVEYVTSSILSYFNI
jgi:dTDP-4-amino-4,6-dideoxygalactose transaminase